MQIITKEILENSIVTFDTNTLIELYSYPNQILEILENEMFSKLNLWLSDHVYFEYESKREEKKNAASDLYNKLTTSGAIYTISESLSNTKTSFDKLLEETQLNNKHPYFEPTLFDNIKLAIDEYESKLIPEVETVKQKISEKVTSIEESEDKIFKLVNDSFSKGRRYSFSEKLKIAEEGRVRFELKISPGWADATGKNAKEGMQKFADLIVWKQICEIAKNEQKDVILISNEYGKGDWCDRVPNENKIESPKQELIDELHEQGGKNFYMITLNQLIYITSNEFEYEIDTEVLKEIDTSQSIHILTFHVDNYSSDFWGIHQEIKGKCFVSNEDIKLMVEELKLTNTKGTNFLVNSINANIGYNNENGRWDMLIRGQNFEINRNSNSENPTVIIRDFELIIDRTKVKDLEGKWIIFQLSETNNENGQIGTMYNHWRSFSINNPV